MKKLISSLILLTLFIPFVSADAINDQPWSIGYVNSHFLKLSNDTSQIVEQTPDFINGVIVSGGTLSADIGTIRVLSANTITSTTGTAPNFSAGLISSGAGDVQIGTATTLSHLYFANSSAEITHIGDIILNPTGNDVLPKTDSTNDFGQTGLVWNEVWTDNIKSDGNILVTPNAGAGDFTINGDLICGDGLGGEDIILNGAAGQIRDFAFQTAGSNRWFIRCNEVAEGGSNAGSDFEIKNRADDGTALSSPFFIKRSTGYFGIGLRSWNTNAPSTVLHIGADDGTIPSLASGTQLLISNNSATNDACNLTLIAGTAITAEICFGDANDENAGIIGYNNNTDTMTFRAGGSGTDISLTTTTTTFASDQILIYTPSTTQSVTAATYTILANAHDVVLDPNGDYTLTSAPTIANGTTGQILYITCGNAEANIVTVQDQDSLANTNLQLGAVSRAISGKDVLILRFDGTDWCEVSYADN